jgi:NhaP-type Na+/H+ or K+/H+ antiporter
MAWSIGLVGDTLGANLLQFIGCFLLWIVAERLELSAVLAIVALAMSIASSGGGGSSPRMRVQSYAVWSAAVFVLNVLAFLLMGMQSRTILAAMTAGSTRHALLFALLVVALVIVTRFAVSMGYNRFATWRYRRGHGAQPATFKQALLGSWCGMRGLVTLATAFALPADFPKRDLVVLTAFAVVIGTLVVQGLTLLPVIRLLGLDRSADGAEEIAAARAELAAAALDALDDKGPEAAELRATYQARIDARENPAVAAVVRRQKELGLAAVAAQRHALEQLRRQNRVNIDEYNLLLEELDWRELTLLPPDQRRLEEH